MERAAERADRFGMNLGALHIASLVNAAHDPALGLDRSVCLRDVVDALEREASVAARERSIQFYRGVAHALNVVRELTARSSSSPERGAGNV
jgi:hypothetical protein